MSDSLDLELAYCAGVLDSDGYIGMRGAPTYSARMQVKQVEDAAVALFRHLFGGSVGRQRPSIPGGRELIAWEAHSLQAEQALLALLPYLRIKRAQAENVLAACAVRRTPKTWADHLPPDAARPKHGPPRSAEVLARLAEHHQRAKALNSSRGGGAL